MRKSLILVLLLCSAICIGFAGQASATTAYWSITHSYPADLWISIGTGDTSSPDWIMTAQDNQWISSGTVDISAGEEYLWGNTWWVRMVDELSWDVGSITAFSITDDYGNIYTSDDVPVYIPDRATRYAFIDMPSDPMSAPVPEPATMLLLGTGLVGLAGYGRKKFKKA